MKIETTSNGELRLNVKSLVYTQFRATARRFLNLPTIKFRDHPDYDIQTVEYDRDRRFVFDFPLRDGYVLFLLRDGRSPLLQGFIHPK